LPFAAPGTGNRCESAPPQDGCDGAATGPDEEVRHMTIEIRTLDKVETTDQCANN
jgi:hypothetical protein